MYGGGGGGKENKAYFMQAKDGAAGEGAEEAGKDVEEEERDEYESRDGNL